MKTSNQESGHIITYTDFKELVTACIGMGPRYNPTRDIQKLPFLGEVIITSKACLDEVKDAAQECTNAIGQRTLLFEPLQTKVSRIVAALISCGAPPYIIKQAASINRKIAGRRLKGKEEAEEITGTQPAPAANTGVELTDKSISVSQQSYDRKVDNYELLVKLVEKVPEWNPSEKDLTLEALRTETTALLAANETVEVMYDKVRSARQKRDDVFYKPITGLVAVAKSVKSYLRSLEGPSGPDFKKITHLQFRNSRK